MSAIPNESRVLFGQIPLNRAILKEDWQGRTWEWLAQPTRCYWITELAGFTFYRACIWDNRFTREAFKSTVSFVCSHLSLRFFDLHHRIHKQIVLIGNQRAHQLTWERVLSATTLEGKSLLSTLAPPLALQPEVLAAYLSAAEITAVQRQSAWFAALLKKGNYAGEVGLEPLAVQLSREAYAYAIYVQEVALMLSQDLPLADTIELPFPPGFTKDLHISKTRFEAIFSRVNNTYLKKDYPALHEALEGLVLKAAAGSTKRKLFLAAHALICLYHKETRPTLDHVAYLYHLAFTEELDPLFNLNGTALALRQKNQKKGESFMGMVDALNSQHVIRVYFDWALQVNLNTLRSDQLLVTQNYELLKTAVEEGLSLPEHLIPLKERLTQLMAHQEGKKVAEEEEWVFA